MDFASIFAVHHLFFHLFAKLCLPHTRGAHFSKTTLSILPSKMWVLNPFLIHWPLRSPPAGPSSASKNVAPVRVLGTFSSWTRFALMIGSSFLLSLYRCWFFFVFYPSWHEFSSTICKFYENVLPAEAGSTFLKAEFCQPHAHDEFSMPKMASRPSLWGGISVLCCAKNNGFHRLSGK